MTGSEFTTINISKKTRDRLKSLGKKSETYDNLLNRLADLLPKA